MAGLSAEGIVTLTGASHSLANSDPSSGGRACVLPDVERCGSKLFVRVSFEEMLAERGLDISYETVRRWFLKFGSTIAANLRRTRPRPSDHWLCLLKIPSAAEILAIG